MPGGKANAATYKPKTHAQVRLSQQIYRDISQATQIPLVKVMKHGDKILQKSMAETIKAVDKRINKIVPKATGQLRNSLGHQLRSNSKLSNNWLRLTLGTYVSYMKYVNNMNRKNLRHPKGSNSEFWIWRTKKNGKKYKIPVGQKRLKGSHKSYGRGQYRWVAYYGPPRLVRLDDPEAQDNFFQKLVLYMRDYLQKQITQEIRATFPAGQRKEWTDTFKVKTGDGRTI